MYQEASPCPQYEWTNACCYCGLRSENKRILHFGFRKPLPLQIAQEFREVHDTPFCCARCMTAMHRLKDKLTRDGLLEVPPCAQCGTTENVKHFVPFLLDIQIEKYPLACPESWLCCVHCQYKSQDRRKRLLDKARGIPRKRKKEFEECCCYCGKRSQNRRVIHLGYRRTYPDVLLRAFPVHHETPFSCAKCLTSLYNLKERLVRQGELRVPPCALCGTHENVKHFVPWLPPAQMKKYPLVVPHSWLCCAKCQYKAQDRRKRIMDKQQGIKRKSYKRLVKDLSSVMDVGDFVGDEGNQSFGVFQGGLSADHPSNHAMNSMTANQGHPIHIMQQPLFASAHGAFTAVGSGLQDIDRGNQRSNEYDVKEDVNESGQAGRVLADLMRARV